MRNGMLIWNLALTLVAATLLFLHFNTGKKRETPRSVSADTLQQKQPTRIAYIDMDSVQEHYGYAKEILDELRKQEQSNSLTMERLGNEYNSKLTAFSQQDQAAGLTQLSEAHQMALMEEQKRISDQRTQMEQDYAGKVSKLELNLRNKIKDYLKIYNQDKKYAYIMSLEDRMFYYVDTLYNVTNDVIKGLNELHKPKKQ